MTCEHLDIDDMLRTLTAPRRNHYYYGKMMDVLHFQMEQRYVNQKRWLINRLSLGDGILCGLGVEAEGDQLCVDCGVGIDCYGREVIVPQRFCVDPWKLLDPCGNPSGELSRAERHVVTLSVCYHECLTDYAPILVSTCETKDECHPGTVIESYRPQIDVGPASRPRPAFDPACCEELLGGTPTTPSDTATFTVVDTLAVGGQPMGVAATADGQWVVIAHTNTAAAAVHVVAVASHAVSAIQADVITKPSGHVAVAPSGGPAFVTHTAGLAVVDPTVSTTSIVKNIRETRSYGAVAAVKAGKTVFAVNVPKKVIEVIDVASASEIGTIPVPGLPRDLAVSPDETYLYITNGDQSQIWRARVDDISEVVGLPIGGAVPVTLAVRGTAAGDEAHVASNNEVRVVDASGSVTTLPVVADMMALDSAFTSNGEGYYVTSQSNAGGEVLVLKPGSLEVVARLPVGREPMGVAVIPGRVRAYVSSHRTGTVSVIDATLDTRPPATDCRRGPCCKVEGCCVVLAQVTLEADGTIGAIETKGLRKPIYSNQMLMEMVLCLARKVKECCDDEPAPTDDFRVSSVELLGDAVLLGTLQDLTNPLVVTSAVDTIRVGLTFPVDPTSVTALPPETATFRVETASGDIVKGSVSVGPAKTVIWKANEPLTEGGFVVTLFGDEDTTLGRGAIRSTNQVRLDGEPLGLPSGNALPGGDFRFKIQID